MITQDNVLIVSPDYLKSQTPILEVVDDQYIRAGILETQKFWILNLLGSKLYEQIKTEISGSTVTSENQTLLDNFIVPVMEYYSMYETLPYLRNKISNKGILNQSSDNSQIVDISEYHELRENIKNKAEYNAQRMIDFLCDNQTDYPLYFNIDTSTDGELMPTRNIFNTGGIFLD